MTVYRVQPAKSSELSYPRVRPTFDENFVETKTLDPVMTFSRSSSGTFVGPDGLIKIAGANQPRFDHNPFTGECRGLLVEENRSNSIRDSSNYTFTNWHYAFCQLTTNATVAPDGSNTAALVRQTNGTSTRQFMCTSYTIPSTGSSWVASVYVKKYNYDYVIFTAGDQDSGNRGDRFGYLQGQFGFNFATKQIIMNPSTNWGGAITGFGYEELSDGWFRIWFSKASFPRANYWGISVQQPSVNGNTGINGDLPLVVGNGISGVYVWGFQWESGPFYTSHIPTGSSAVTRAADKPIINRTINTSGTLYAEAITPRTSGVILSADNGTQALSITLNNANDSKYALYYNTNRYLQTSSSSTLIPTEIRDITIPSNINRISLGYSELTSSGYINGTIKRFSYYAAPLTEPNVKGLVGNTNNTFRDPFGIITPGLVLNLDAGNTLSYSGAGNTWFDLSGNGFNGTLINGPTFNNANNGAIVFDGVNDYITVANNNYLNTNNFTVSLWMYLDNITTTFRNYTFLDKNVYNTSGISASLGTGGSTSNRILSVRYSTTGNIEGNFNFVPAASLVTFDAWHHVVLIFSYTAPNSQIFVYIDNTYVGATGVLSGTFVPNTTALNIGSPAAGNGVYHKGRIGSYQIYNSALSSTEVAQNFNAQRTRYGV